jgi:hypothetical protein
MKMRAVSVTVFNCVLRAATFRTMDFTHSYFGINILFTCN